MTDSNLEANTDPSSEQSGNQGTDQSTILTGDASDQSGGENPPADDNATSEGGEGSPQGADNADKTDETGENSDDGANGDVPESYEFTAPEGMELDQKLIDAVSPVFKDMGLTQAQATQLNAAFGEYMKGVEEASVEAFTSQLNSWRSELQNDKSFGGENFDQNAQAVQSFIEKTAPNELKENLREFFFSTGAGNHPGLVKYFHHLSKTFPVDEDSPNTGTSSTPARSDSLESKTERWYGK